MTRPRLALLDASHGAEHTRRNFRRELDADLAEFDVTAGELPPAFEDGGPDVDGVVVTGSRASVYWEEPWIEPTTAWVESAIEAGLPCLGICWGHQLLADVLGGTVAAMDTYELGYVEVQRRGESRLLADVEDPFTAFATHSDEVVELPPGADLLAESDRSIHGFRVGDVFGVQFHPEYDAETARSVTESKRGEASPERVEQALASITPERVAAAEAPKALFENFLGIVAEHRDAPATAADAA